MSARGIACVLAVSVYLSWQFSLAISHVSAGPQVEAVHGDRGSDLVDRVERVRRKANFDWQKDESSEDNDDKDHVAAVSNQHANRKHGTDGDSSASRKYDHDRAFKSDIKAILWSSGHDITSSAMDSDKNEPKETHWDNTDNDSSAAPSQEVRVVALGARDQHFNNSTINDTPAAVDYLTEDGRVQHHVFYSSKLSVSEDKLREYTLAEGQRYGIGRAKPRHITEQLSKAEVIEYNEDEHRLNSLPLDHVQAEQRSKWD